MRVGVEEGEEGWLRTSCGSHLRETGSHVREVVTTRASSSN